jgi:polyhydroxyalkanoate synthesis regulator phasin
MAKKKDIKYNYNTSGTNQTPPPAPKNLPAYVASQEDKNAVSKNPTVNINLNTGKKEEIKDPNISALGSPLNPNRVARYYAGKGEVTEEEYKAAVQETKNQMQVDAGTAKYLESPAVIAAKAEEEDRLKRAVGGIGTLTPEQEALDVVKDNPVETGGIIAAGLGGALTLGTGGAIVGSAVPIFGNVAGAVVGGIAGFVGGAFTKLTLSKRSDVKTAFKTYKTAKSNMAWIINQVNAGKMSSYQALEMFDNELAYYRSAERNIKEDTSSNLDRFLSGGDDELVDVESFNRRIPSLQTELALAIMNPDPTKVIMYPEEESSYNE